MLGRRALPARRRAPKSTTDQPIQATCDYGRRTAPDVCRGYESVPAHRGGRLVPKRCDPGDRFSACVDGGASTERRFAPDSDVMRGRDGSRSARAAQKIIASVARTVRGRMRVVVARPPQVAPRAIGTSSRERGPRGVATQRAASRRTAPLLLLTRTDGSPSRVHSVRRGVPKWYLLRSGHAPRPRARGSPLPRPECPMSGGVRNTAVPGPWVRARAVPRSRAPRP